MMTVLLTISQIGSDNFAFDLYSDLDNFTTPFETDVLGTDLLNGYTSSLVPDYTNIVRVQALGKCVNYLDIVLENITTTTTLIP
tara:strand:- start:5548 stop:5799 length:252 start_codon:yes stop_codon:yes gene_type:complete